MAFPGPFELMVIAAILGVSVGIPLAIIAAVILLVKRTGSATPRDNEQHD